MAGYDFQCLLCGSQFDGGVQHERPEHCPDCGGPESEIVDAELAEEREARNAAINAEDDYLEELRNE